MVALGLKMILGGNDAGECLGGLCDQNIVPCVV